MADEEKTEETIWQKLGLPDPELEDEEEKYETEAEEAEAEAEAEDKIARKLSSKVDNLQKKFDSQMLAITREKYLETVDPLERDLFKAIAGDIKDPESLGRAIEMVHNKAEEMKAATAKYEEEARAQVAKAYGVNPGAPSSGVPEDEITKLHDKVKKGDLNAAFKLFNAAPSSGEPPTPD